MAESAVQAAIVGAKRCGVRKKEAGADSAVVHPRGDDAHPAPARLYGGLGFEARARTVTYVR